MIGNTFRGLWVPKRLVGQIRPVKTANLFIAIAGMLIMVEACLGSSDAGSGFSGSCSYRGLIRGRSAE